MPTHVDSFSPAGWEAATDAAGNVVAGAWEKELRRPSRGDHFVLVQVAAGVAWSAPAGIADRLLVLEGEALLSKDGAGEPTVARRGAYLDVSSSALELSTTSGVLILLISGEHLGGPVDDIWSPGGWLDVGRGMSVRPLLMEQLDGSFEERVAGVFRLAPGGGVDFHAHPTTHLFLFLDGEADDEVVHPDGTRDIATRRRGDFVEYPYPVDHRSSSRVGCTILFIHEPVSATEPTT
jgi:quercetin dioxygenase-like cupin family protein